MRFRHAPASEETIAPPPPPSPAAPPVRVEVAGYRLLRRIAEGDRAQIQLATIAGAASSGETTLVVARLYPPGADQDAITREVEAMSAVTDGSLPALLDIATLGDGAVCVIVERAGGPSLAQIMTDRQLTAGEAVTVLAPLAATIVGLAEAGFVHTGLSAADLRLDDRGRPRLLGLGGLARLPEPGAPRTAMLREALSAFAGLIAEIGEATSPPGVLDDVATSAREAAEARPFRPLDDELERRLFAITAPEPVGGVRARERLALPARIVVPSAHHVAETDDGHAQGTRAPAFEVCAGSVIGARRAARAQRAVPAGLSVGALRLRAGAFIAQRRRPLLVGGLCGGAALLVMLALVPPGGQQRAVAGSEMVPSSASPSALAARSAVPTNTPAKRRDAASPAALPADDLAEIAAELLRRRERCVVERQLACLADVDQIGSPIEAADRDRIGAAHDGTAKASTLDPAGVVVSGSMGQAVLVQVPYTDAGRQPASLLMMRSEAGWRLRELFD